MPANHRHHAPDNRPGARQRGYTEEWERTRSIYLQMFPMCQAYRCVELAEHVHHLDGQGPKGSRGHDFTNLQGLCASHHSQTTAQEQPGGWHKGDGKTNQRLA
jgi:5-methylcytosine-specific restriction protein A